MISGRRKDIKDDNNYIGQYGKITHFCPKCKSIYTEKIRLDVTCEMPCCASDNYYIGSPSILRTCDNCNINCVPIDNLMQYIIQDLSNKGYEVRKSCEGHAYEKDGIMTYTYPFVELEGDIKYLIPTIYHSKFNIKSVFNITTIQAPELVLNDCLCINLEEFNKYKTEMLASLGNLACALPEYKKESTTCVKCCNSASCNTCYCE